MYCLKTREDRTTAGRRRKQTRRAAVIKLEIAAAIGSRGAAGAGGKDADGRGLREASPQLGGVGGHFYIIYNPRKIDIETCV